MPFKQPGSGATAHFKTYNDSGVNIEQLFHISLPGINGDRRTHTVPTKGAIELLALIAPLSSIIPLLAPSKQAIEGIAATIEDLGNADSRCQCMYLLKRCINLCLRVNRLCSEARGNGAQQYNEPLAKLNSEFEKIFRSLEGLSVIKPFRRFIQQNEISASICERHKSLDDCMELFNLKGESRLAFDADMHEAARQQDQDLLGNALVHQNSTDILQSLDLQGDQILDVIHGLRRTISRGIDDPTQGQFAKESLQKLEAQQAKNHPTSPPIAYDWSVSSLEILVESEVLGSGAFGIVYAGRWNGTRVAIKQLTSSTSRETLIREINIWRRLQHPHIASFFRACLDTSPPLLVLELYPFGNAMNYLSKFPKNNRVKMCHEISLGMVFLHAQSIVHGDLKPANILVDNGHCARIADFGLAKVKSTMTTLTVANSQEAQRTISGTSAFMSPERLARGTMTFSTDVYAFSMTMYQIVTGEAPFQYLPEGDIRVVVVDMDERPERPEEPKFPLTDSIWYLITACWITDRKKRPPFTDIAGRLQPLIADGEGCGDESLSDMDDEYDSPPSPTEYRLFDFGNTLWRHTFGSGKPMVPTRRKGEKSTLFLSIGYTSDLKDRNGNEMDKDLFYAVLTVDGQLIGTTAPQYPYLSYLGGEFPIAVRESSDIRISVYQQPNKEYFGTVKVSGRRLISFRKPGIRVRVTEELMRSGSSCGTLLFLVFLKASLFSTFWDVNKMPDGREYFSPLGSTDRVAWVES